MTITIDDQLIISDLVLVAPHTVCTSIFWDSYMLLIIWSNSCTRNNRCYLWNRTKISLPTISASLLVEILALPKGSDRHYSVMHPGLFVQFFDTFKIYLHRNIQRFFYAVKPIIIIYIHWPVHNPKNPFKTDNKLSFLIVACL